MTSLRAAGPDILVAAGTQAEIGKMLTHRERSSEIAARYGKTLAVVVPQF